MTLTIAGLLAACQGRPGLLANPGRSPGCSPALRAVLAIAGLDCPVARELAFDNEPHGHEGGNAIDVTGELEVAAAVLTQCRTLFATAVYAPPAALDQGLYIYDGQLVDPATLPAAALATYPTGMHLSSSYRRLAAALSTAVVQDALLNGAAL